MDKFIKNIKKKLAVEDLEDKKANVIDENAKKEEAVRNTLQKLDPNSELDVDEIHEKLNDISNDAEKAKPKAETSMGTRILNVAKSSISSSMPAEQEEDPKKNPGDNEYLKALGREENVFNLNDDFH